MSSLIATIPGAEIAKFCRRWKVEELALFGSALRDDFGPASDVDILVTPAYAGGAEWGLFERVEMQRELQTLIGRNVDLVTKRAVERSQNWLRREDILSTAQVVYPHPEAGHATG